MRAKVLVEGMSVLVEGNKIVRIVKSISAPSGLLLETSSIRVSILSRPWRSGVRN